MGSREVCQTLLYLVTNSFLMTRPPRLNDSVNPRQRGMALEESRE